MKQLMRDVRETHSIGSRTRERLAVVSRDSSLDWTGITCLGLSDATAGFHFATQGWRCSQLLVCNSGLGQVLVHGQWLDCVRGQAYLTPAGLPHAYRAAAGKRWNISWITYDPRVVKLPLDDLDHAMLIHVNPQPVKWAIQGLCEEWLTQRDPAIAQSWAQVLLQEARRLTSADRPADRLWHLWQTIETELSKPWSLTQLARRAHLSSEHLRRLCLVECGRSPMSHVMHMRIRRAAILLRATDMKIEAIATAVGYADRFGFSLAFKRCTGTTPTAFRHGTQSNNMRL